MQDKTRPLALIVEDEALLALAVEDLLTEEGFDTLCATSEGQVLALIPAAGPLAVAVVDLASRRDANPVAARAHDLLLAVARSGDLHRVD